VGVALLEKVPLPDEEDVAKATGSRRRGVRKMKKDLFFIGREGLVSIFKLRGSRATLFRCEGDLSSCPG